jgi:hypothetical protein
MSSNYNAMLIVILHIFAYFAFLFISAFFNYMRKNINEEYEIVLSQYMLLDTKTATSCP